MRILCKLPFLFCLLCLFLLGMPGSAPAATPAVTSFISEAKLSANGVLTVRELLKVWLPAGRFGVDRDIPFIPGIMYVRTDSSMPEIIELSIDGVKQNVKDVELVDKRLLRVHVRDMDTPLSEGEHSIIIRYLVRGQVNMLKDRDELSWNVFGPNWQMPINEAIYSLTMPQTVAKLTSEVRFGDTVCTEDQFTKAQGDHRGCTTAAFRANRPLLPGETMTVSLSWEKGIIAPPPSPDRFQKIHEKTIGLALLAVIFLYFAIIWIKFHHKNTVVFSSPLYAPPLAPASASQPEETRLSAPAFGFVMDAGQVEPKTLAAALLALAQKGCCKIRGTRKGGFTIEPRTVSEPEAREEQALYSVLKERESVSPNRHEDHAVLKDMQRALEHALAVSYPKAVRHYLEFIWLGVALALVCAGVTLWCSFGSPEIWPGNLIDFLMLSLFACFMAGVLVSPFYWGLNLTGKVILGIVAIVLMNLAYIKAEEIFVLMPLWLIGTTLCQILLPLPFFLLLKNISSIDDMLFAQCKRFSLYLTAIKTKSFAKFNPPKHTPELYTNLLPYAVAAQGEKNWYNRCSSSLSALPSSKRLFGSLDDMDAFIQAINKALSPDTQKPSSKKKK